MDSLNLPELPFSRLLNGGNKEKGETDSGLAEQRRSILLALLLEP